MQEKKLFLFDLDNTITESISGETFPKTVNDRKFMSGRKEKLLELHGQGKITAIVTNQGGCAWKFFTQEDMDTFLTNLCISAGISKFFVCYHDTGEKARQYIKTRPEQFIASLVLPDLTPDGWERRKPGPGMLIEAMQHFGIDRQNTIMIGDRSEDLGATENASVDFVWTKDFFGD